MRNVKFKIKMVSTGHHFSKDLNPHFILGDGVIKMEPKKRNDLIGQTATRLEELEIIDAMEYETGVSVRVEDVHTGDKYWTGLDDIDIDD